MLDWVGKVTGLISSSESFTLGLIGASIQLWDITGVLGVPNDARLTVAVLFDALIELQD